MCAEPFIAINKEVAFRRFENTKLGMPSSLANDLTLKYLCSFDNTGKCFIDNNLLDYFYNQEKSATGDHNETNTSV